MTISQKYKAENERLHTLPGYGSSGHLWLGHILEIAEATGAETILDYGAGKATLGPYLERLGYTYVPFDPATYPEEPQGKFDMVVCLDVLEHIEPDLLDEVLDHISGLTGRVLFCVVSTRASSKTLSDGRNAHLIQEDWWGWKPHLKNRWQAVRTRQHPDTFDFIGASPGGITQDARLKLRGAK